MWISDKELKALNARIDLAADGARQGCIDAADLRKETSVIVDNIILRLDALEKSYRRGSLEMKESEKPVVVSPGFKTLRQKKAEWEAQHMKKGK